MIQTNNLSIKYESHKIKFPDINLNSGDSLLILGKSGSGKTSMLNLLGGLASPYSGTVTINSQIINSLTSNQIDKFRGSNIGLFSNSSFKILVSPRKSAINPVFSW